MFAIKFNQKSLIRPMFDENDRVFIITEKKSWQNWPKQPDELTVQY